MNDKLSKWITALEEIKNNILNTLNYNGLTLDDIDKVIKDIKEAQKKLNGNKPLCFLSGWPILGHPKEECNAL